MAVSVMPDTHCSRLSRFIAEAMGLHFPRERWPDLQRGLAGAAVDFGFDDLTACADWLLSAPLSKEQLQVLASHLTIGETYFFRDKQTLAALTENILPGLIRTRRGSEQRLRLWSAACCSGEEPYTLAILLHQLLPDIADWHVTIRATDINPGFLRKAQTGVYGEWSFRNAPAALKARYFTRAADGRYAVNSEIRDLVSFAHLNLVDDVYPSPVTDTNAMDLICCRNVLMYFTAAQIERVI
jgi:chemotaxis protein methyltransferase CheR